MKQLYLLIYPIHLDAEDKVLVQEDGSYHYGLHMVLVVCTCGYNMDYLVFGLVEIDMQPVAGRIVVAGVVVVIAAVAVVVMPVAVVAAGYTVVHFVVVLQVAIQLVLVEVILLALAEHREPQPEGLLPLVGKHFRRHQIC